MDTTQKLARLRAYIADMAPRGLCVAFSGGVDSAVILALARETGGAVHAVTMHTPFHSLKEPESARKLAEDLGATHAVITLDTLSPELMLNPTDRCYLCKKWIFTALGEYAAAHGLQYVVDGTNADDLNEYRPGLQALKELDVKSPLAQCGVTKEQVREIAAVLGISVAKKPSSPCLATRFPYGTRLARETLQKADEIENFIKALGPQTVRARIHGDTVRVEVPPEDFDVLIRHRKSLAEKVHSCGFIYVTLDLEGFRSGSMDAGIKKGKAAGSLKKKKDRDVIPFPA
jgi:uncharacterized protein